MRWMQWGSALLVLAALASPVTAANYGRNTTGGCASCERTSGYAAPACAGPIGYSLTPGCCECPPSACDNAWAGYCQEKARWQAFWSRVGTPRPKCGTAVCYPAGQTPTGATRLPPVGPQSAPTEPAGNGLQPIPEPIGVEPPKTEDTAYPPADKPIPNEALRRWTKPAFR
jgi:hypothetical protein